ncbi:unnamed protein product, partial [Adineta steineri]
NPITLFTKLPQITVRGGSAVVPWNT